MPNYNHRKAVADAAKAVKLERLDANPFISKVEPTRTYKHKPAPGMFFKNEETGEEIPLTYRASQYSDNEQFVKVFKRGYQALKFIGVAGAKVLEYVFDRLQADQGVVWLVQADYAESLKQKPGSYYVGLNELIAAQFVAPSSEKGFYFINPSFFFSGNRLNIRHDFLKPNKPKPISE